MQEETRRHSRKAAIGLGILLRWKDKATAEMRKAKKALGSLGEEVDDVEKKTARLQPSFAKLAKVGAGITAFGVGGAAALYGLARSATGPTRALPGAVSRAFVPRDLVSFLRSNNTHSGCCC